MKNLKSIDWLSIFIAWEILALLWTVTKYFFPFFFIHLAVGLIFWLIAMRKLDKE